MKIKSLVINFEGLQFSKKSGSRKMMTKDWKLMTKDKIFFTKPLSNKKKLYFCSPKKSGSGCSAAR